MLDRFLSFLKGLPPGDGASQRLDADDPRVAAAALLFHAMGADGERSAVEQKQLQETLSRAYDLHGAELKAVMEAGAEAEADAVDLYTFTSVLKRHLDEDARAEFIGRMWEVIFADGELHELEDNLVWRVAELIGVDTRTRVAMRQRVQRKHGREGDA